MAHCEICGASDTPLQQAQVAGSTVQACSPCVDADTGTADTQDTNTATTSTSHPLNGAGPGLAPDYGTTLREAREQEGLSQDALADQLNLKQSVLRRVENQELTPDQDLVNTLESALSVSLTADTPRSDTASTHHSTETGDGAATLGDVADINTAD
jgi:putative transcription factor